MLSTPNSIYISAKHLQQISHLLGAGLPGSVPSALPSSTSPAWLSSGLEDFSAPGFCSSAGGEARSRLLQHPSWSGVPINTTSSGSPSGPKLTSSCTGCSLGGRGALACGRGSAAADGVVSLSTAAGRCWPELG